MSNVDWSKAPEDATHCIYGSVFYKVCNGTMMRYNQSERLWKLSAYKGVAELKDEYSVIERPKPEEMDVNKQVFKVGDKVYFPFRSCDLYTVDGDDLGLMVAGYTFHKDGTQLKTATTTIIHATPENKAMLEQLYRTEFESLPVRLSGSDLTRAKLEETGKLILCWVSDESDEDTIPLNHAVLIAAYTDCFIASSGVQWKYAVPYTGDEFLTGKDFE
jgi:hypothetical protein